MNSSFQVNTNVPLRAVLGERRHLTWRWFTSETVITSIKLYDPARQTHSLEGDLSYIHRGK